MALWLYRLITASLFPFLKFFGKFFPARWEIGERLDAGMHSETPALWLHGASLGEARALRALAENLKWAGTLLITTTTTSGRDWLNKEAARGGAVPFGGPRFRIRLMPLDHSILIRSFIARNRIRVALFHEMELWPNTLKELRKAAVPAVWVSARLTPRAVRWYGVFRASSRNLMRSFAWIQARSESDAAALMRFGIESAPGFDFKAAHYLSRSDETDQPRNAFAFLSLHVRELSMFLPLLPALMKKFPLLVFPRRPGAFARFRSLLSPLGFAIASRGEKGPHLLVDTFGEVGHHLPRCHSAFVGGTLIPIGGHNFWEPLAAGVKIYCGPHVFNQEPLAARMVAAGLAEMISGARAAESWKIPAADFPAQCGKFMEGERARLKEALGSLDAFVRDYL